MKIFKLLTKKGRKDLRAKKVQEIKELLEGEYCGLEESDYEITQSGKVRWSYSQSYWDKLKKIDEVNRYKKAAMFE